MFYRKDTIEKVIRQLLRQKVLKTINLSKLHSHILSLHSDKFIVEVDRKKLTKLRDDETPKTKETILVMEDKKCSFFLISKTSNSFAKQCSKIPWGNLTIDLKLTKQYMKIPTARYLKQKNYHRVYDMVQQINQRVRKDLSIDKVFDWWKMTSTRLL